MALVRYVIFYVIKIMRYFWGKKTFLSKGTLA